MPSKGESAGPRLIPQQVCYVVDDVAEAVAFSQEHFGWGPFFQFQAPVPEASYKDWRGEKLTDVALGMAGKVQVEFLHIHKGRDTTADYQAQYGTGLQHLGIHSESRDEALAHLEAIGGQVNELNEYPGIRFAFVDVPTGPGMFEILQPTAAMADNDGITASRKPADDEDTLFDIDRATLVTRDIEGALKFFSAAFGWDGASASTETLCIGGQQAVMKRYLGHAGRLELEFIQPGSDGDNPYSAHLERGPHGLVHAGGVLKGEAPTTASLQGSWLETGESFSLYHWAGGRHSLQIRH